MLRICSHSILPSFLIAAGVSILPLYGQVESGRISGTVLDPNRASISGAQVTVTSKATQQVISVITGDNGAYTVTPLNPGQYRVSVTAPGFGTAVADPVEVQVNQSTRTDVELPVGSMATAELLSCARSGIATSMCRFSRNSPSGKENCCSFARNSLISRIRLSSPRPTLSSIRLQAASSPAPRIHLASCSSH